MKRRALNLGLGSSLIGGLGFNLSAGAQAGVPRIGVLRWGASGDDAHVGLGKALAAAGYRDGQTIMIEWRFATNRELARRHAAELAGMNLDLIIASATPAAVALRDATKSVPIVSAGVADPVGAGLVASLARPGGNITGVSTNLPVMVPKQLQMLREVSPSLQRAAFLGSTDDPVTKLFVEHAQTSARAVGVTMQVVLISQAREYPSALDAMLRDGAQAVVVQPLFAVSDSSPLADLLAHRRLLSVTAQRTFPLAGGLMSYGFSREEASRRAASFVQRILRGAKPADLPVEEPTTYELALNLTTAKALELTVPQSVLLRVDELIA